MESKKFTNFKVIAFIIFIGLTSCDKYNDELLTDVEVEEYGYILPEIKDEDDNYSLSDMNYTHSLNLCIPLVYEEGRYRPYVDWVKVEELLTPMLDEIYMNLEKVKFQKVIK